MNVATLHERLIEAMGVPGLSIPMTAVKIYSDDDAIPEALFDHHPDDITLTSCQAVKQAGLGEAVLLTRKNIGCIAAAISLGIVDQTEEGNLGSTVYTDIMKEQSGNAGDFTPPSPKEFTDGIVYACSDANRPDFALFGSDDSGRYKDVATAKKAVSEMMAIQPATTKAIFLFSEEFCDIEITPDVVIYSVRPVELTRMIQAYQFMTGERIEANMGPVRMVNSDLIARPYLTGKINVSTYCLGARLIARYESDRMGIGIPFKAYETMVEGMSASRTGYPFQLYPGAVKNR